MGYLLLWLFVLAAGVSWLAAAMATPTRVSSLISRILVRLILVAPVLAAAGWGLMGAMALRQRGLIHAGDAWVIYTATGLLPAMQVLFLFQRWWQRPKDPQAVEQQSVRRRTVGALYGLAILCAGLHGFTAWVLAGAAVGVVEAEMVVPQATAQAYLDADHVRWEPVLAQRDADQPRDFVSAWKAYENDPDPQVKARRAAMSARLQGWYEPIFQQGRPILTWKLKLTDWWKTGTAEDDIEETLPATLARFAPEIEALRQLTAVRPFNAEPTLEKLRVFFDDDDPLMALQVWANQLKVDATGRIALGDLAAAAADFEAIRNLSDLAFERQFLIAGLIGIGCRSTAQDMTESYLSAPGLTAADLARLAPPATRSRQTCQQHFPRVFDFELWFQMQATAKAAGGQVDPFGVMASFPWHGYAGWLVRAYLPTTAAQDLPRVAAELRPFIGQPYFQNRAIWETKHDRARDGFDGSDFRGMAVNILQACVRVDTRDDLLTVGCAAAAYKLKNGRFPAALTDLTPAFLPALPIDPFSGKALLFRVEDAGQGLVIWSVGDDGEDNGALLEAECEHPDIDITLFLGTSYDQAHALAQKKLQDYLANN